MAKDPAFLFYSDKFISGTITMSFEDRGKYITLLALMHQKGRLSEQTISFLVGNVSLNLASKFAIDKNGLWYNEVLEEIVEKRKKFSQSRSDNGSKGGRPKKSESIEKAPDKPLGYVGDNLPVNTIINTNVNPVTVLEGVQGEIVIFTIEHCKVVAMNDSRWMKANKALEVEIDTFNEHLESQGVYEQNPMEYKKHFANWKKKLVTNGIKSHSAVSTGTGTKLGTSEAREQALANWGRG